MEFTRIWNHIKRLASFYRVEEKTEDEEILKPLNQLIDFEKKECIYNNHIYLNGI